MRHWIAFLLFFGSGAFIQAADVYVSVWEYDENNIFTPFIDRDVHVGETLALKISSTEGSYWSGSLFIEDENMDLGYLSFHQNDLLKSITPNAGSIPSIDFWQEQDFEGYDLTNDFDAKDGEWFVLDYTAIAPGSCEINFYQWFTLDSTITINQVVPEPVTLLLMVSGCLTCMRRRMHRSRSSRNP